MIRVFNIRSATQSLSVRAFAKKIHVDKTVNKVKLTQEDKEMLNETADLVSRVSLTHPSLDSMFISNGKNIDWQKLKAAQQKIPDLSVKPLDVEEAQEERELKEFHRKNKFTPTNEDERILFNIARNNMNFVNSLNVYTKDSSAELDDFETNLGEEQQEIKSKKIHPSYFEMDDIKSGLSPIYSDELLKESLSLVPEEHESNFITYAEYEPQYVKQFYTEANGPNGVVSENLLPFLEDPDEYSQDSLTRNRQPCEGRLQRRGKLGTLGCHKVDLDKLSFQDLVTLRRFLSIDGEILHRKITGLCGKCQREVARTVKHARSVGLLPHIGNFEIRPVNEGVPRIDFHVNVHPNKPALNSKTIF